VSRATWKGERTVFGTLATLGPLVREAQLEAPTILIVGEVVARAVSSPPAIAAAELVALIPRAAAL
jgi:siroheme synthase